MPNFPPNYKEQESYYASQEYQTAAKTAIKENKKLPVYGGPQGGLDKKKKQTSSRDLQLNYTLIQFHKVQVKELVIDC